MKYSEFKRKWENCRRCSLCEGRTKVVMARGKMPCDVLLVGEAPGASEDVIGRPFVGPAGKLLDQILEKGIGRERSYCLTNLVGCFPREAGGKEKAAEPPMEAIVACRERLEWIVEKSGAFGVVAVGKLAAKHVEHDLEIIHPAAILRMDVSQKGLAIQRCVVALRDFVEELPPF